MVTAICMQGSLVYLALEWPCVWFAEAYKNLAGFNFDYYLLCDRKLEDVELDTPGHLSLCVE